MAKQEMVTVGYEGKQYEIPADVAQLNVMKPGVAKAWIEDQIAEEADRQQQAKARHEASVEAEFESISAKLEKVDGIEATMAAMQQTIDSYASANQALNAQVAALEESGGVLGGANASARQTAYDLSNASTVALGTLSSLQAENERLNQSVERMQTQLDGLLERQSEQLEEGRKAGTVQQRLQQEASNRALNKAYEAEARAAKAEGVAAQAERDAMAAQNLSRNDITRANVIAMVQNEIENSAENITEMVIAAVRDQFPQGLHGIRMDAGHVAQTTKDRANDLEVKFGLDDKVKKAILRGQK